MSRRRQMTTDEQIKQFLESLVYGNCSDLTVARAHDIVLDLEAERATLARVRDFAVEMRGWCSPNGFAMLYSERLIDVLDGSGE